MQILGIDIGGSGIKGALVDIKKGGFSTDRHRIPTPQPATPKAVAKVVKQIVQHFSWQDPFGCTFPAIVQNGVVWSAANVDKSWINTRAQHLFQKKTKLPVVILNDADAAGLAEMRFGVGRDEKGVVMMLTFGTGIGSALFYNGQLVPNTELGHLKLWGKDAEDHASDRIRTQQKLSWKTWGKRVKQYLEHIEHLFSPDLIIIGGGVSKKHEKYFRYLDIRTPIVPAELRNKAGIIGAAMAAKELKIK